MIIAIAGQFCSGKTEACNYLREKYGFIEVNFATKLKSMVADLFGVKTKERKLLQDFGEKMRELDKDVWVNYVFNRTIPELITPMEVTPKRFCIGDMRHPNEVDACKKNNAITIYLKCPLSIRLERYQQLYGRLPTTEELNHASEKLKEEYGFDFVLDSSQKNEYLYYQIDKIISKMTLN